jgi:hypothetical protein
MHNQKAFNLFVLLNLAVAMLTGGAAPEIRSGEESSNFAAARAAMMSITPGESKGHVQRLASVEFEGREAGTPGEIRAAKYIAKEFSKYGLTPLAADGSYFQSFQLEQGDLRNASLQLMADGQMDSTTTFSLKGEFIPFSFTGEGAMVAPIVFAGYGITAPEYQYDDYRNLDVKGKVVLVLRHEPRENDDNSIFAGIRLTRHALFETKAENAHRHGAAAMLLVSDPASGHANLEPQGYWPSIHGERVTPLRWQLQKHSELAGFPSIWVDVAVANQILKKRGKSLEELQRAIDQNLRPLSFEISDCRISLGVDLDKTVRRAQNVVGLLKGSDPEIGSETVVIGAHFDHLGMMGERIYRGADDNASGTAGMLEIAEAFSELAGEHRRSVLFIAFSAEELGLLGSEYYVDNPLRPLETTVAMLNLDMIGRNDENEVTVIGSQRSPALHEINLAANQEIGLDFKYNGEHFFNRSDQANFAKHNIPVIFYNTDSHEDYHRPTDVPERVNAAKVSRIARLTFLVAWEVANSDTRPVYIAPRDIQ